MVLDHMQSVTRRLFKADITMNQICVKGAIEFAKRAAGY